MYGDGLTADGRAGSAEWVDIVWTDDGISVLGNAEGVVRG